MEGLMLFHAADTEEQRTADQTGGIFSLPDWINAFGWFIAASPAPPRSLRETSRKAIFTFCGGILNSFTLHLQRLNAVGMRKSWWKIVCVLLLFYTIAGGLLLPVPAREILHETIRNLFFHVCMWMSMMVLLTTSVIYSIKYLRTQNLKDDIYAVNFAKMGILFGVLGYATGAVWAKYTWTEFADATQIFTEPKLTGAAIALLIYFAYLVLRGSLTDIDKKARISAVYNIFAFAMLFPTIWILPRLMESLHPGKEGNPALNFKDSDARLKMVFYPAIIGWTLLGVWITSLKIRIDLIKEKSLLNG